MKKTWTNKYDFCFYATIQNKSNITPFMVKHKMFPGNKISCSTNMMPMTKKFNKTQSLQIKVKVYNGIHVVDEFTLTQGMFCKVMSNIYFAQISKEIN